MTATVKPLNATLVTLGASPNTVNQAKCVQIVNSNTTTVAVITVANATANGVAGVCMVPPLGTISVLKLAGDTLVSNVTAGVFAASIAFTN